MIDRVTDKPGTIAVLMGGTSSEREVSLVSGKRVMEALQQLGYAAKAHVYEGELDDTVSFIKDFDMVFIALHGGDGEGGVVQRALEKAGITFTGSGSAASAAAMDKHGSKVTMREIDVRTADWVKIDLPDDDRHLHSGDIPELQRFCHTHPFPLIIKPNSEGSTVGFAIIKSSGDMDSAINVAAQFGHQLIVEDYVPGRELTVTVFDDRPLPIVEILPKNDYYDYDSKYVDDMCDYIVPAPLSTELTGELQAAALNLHRTLGCRHYSRADFRLTDDGLGYCLELNTLPGLTSHSLTPMAAAAAQIGFNDLIGRLISMAWTQEKSG